MFTITSYKENELDFIILQNKAKTTRAVICLQQGGRLKELKFNGVDVVTEQANFDYETSYASSVLFPFASRIKDGHYTFLGRDYQFFKNDNKINALHGLVFDKSFELFEPEEHLTNCSATFNYYENNESIGFPFKYFISLTYTLYDNSLDLKVTIKNIDDLPFPFILGWHPYFISSDIKNSALTFNSDKRVQFDENLITKDIINDEQKGVFKIEDKQLDDCFFLADNQVGFTTPDYNIKITSNSEKNFLQVYTPPNFPIIAIEPMTGISNSFNNKIGLQVLQPDDTYAVKWGVNFSQPN